LQRSARSINQSSTENRCKDGHDRKNRRYDGERFETDHSRSPPSFAACARIGLAPGTAGDI